MCDISLACSHPPSLCPSLSLCVSVFSFPLTFFHSQQLFEVLTAIGLLRVALLGTSFNECVFQVLARARAMEQEKAGQTPTGGEAVQFVDEELPLESPMDQLSPAVEQLLEKEIEQLVLNDQEGTIASPGGALALSGKEKKGNTITDWLLPNIIMPSLAFLLIVCAVVFAADTALVFLAKSSVIQSLGLPPIDLSPACLAKDQRVREIGAALLYVLGGYALRFSCSPPRLLSLFNCCLCIAFLAHLLAETPVPS